MAKMEKKAGSTKSPAAAGEIKPAKLITPAAGVHLFSSSDDLSLDRMRMTWYGPPGQGKTFLAGSMSEFWPGEIPAKPRVTLEDTIWVAHDPGATSGFREAGIICPNIIDVKRLMTPPRKGEPDRPYARNIMEACRMITQGIKEMVFNSDTIKLVVVDTVSFFDKDLVYYWTEENPPTTKDGKYDGFAAFRNVANTHYKYRDFFLKLPCHIVFLCHSKVFNEEQAGSSEKAKATFSRSDVEAIPDITGQAAMAYSAGVDIEGVIRAVPLPGKTGQFSRKIYPVGGNAFRGKNRFQHSLDYEMDADLGKLMARLRAANE